jgi:hypothetical protein
LRRSGTENPVSVVLHVDPPGPARTIESEVIEKGAVLSEGIAVGGKVDRTLVVARQQDDAVSDPTLKMTAAIQVFVRIR